MASETLTVPEERLADVILVIRCGLCHVDESVIHNDVTPKLLEWCGEMEEYLKRLAEDDDG